MICCSTGAPCASAGSRPVIESWRPAPPRPGKGWRPRCDNVLQSDRAHRCSAQRMLPQLSWASIGSDRGVVAGPHLIRSCRKSRAFRSRRTPSSLIAGWLEVAPLLFAISSLFHPSVLGNCDPGQASPALRSSVAISTFSQYFFLRLQCSLLCEPTRRSCRDALCMPSQRPEQPPSRSFPGIVSCSGSASAPPLATRPRNGAAPEGEFTKSEWWGVGIGDFAARMAPSLPAGASGMAAKSRPIRTEILGEMRTDCTCAAASCDRSTRGAAP